MASKGYKILDHPADLGIEAFGKDLKEAFEEAALALMSVILDPSTIEDRESRDIYLSATDYERLLVKWLTEVLYLYDGQGFAGGRFEVTDLQPKELKATILGEKFDVKKHNPRVDVKAVTYHQIAVTDDGGGAKVRVFLDI